MKQSVLARPNLKLFLLGAVLVAIVEHFILDGRSQETVIVQARTANAASQDAFLATLLEQVRQNPTPELCNQISSIYERQGDFRKAIVYLRQSEILAEFEEP